MYRYVFDFTKFSKNLRVPEHLHHLSLPVCLSRYLYRYHIKNPYGIKQIFVKDNRVVSFLNANLSHERYVDIELLESDGDFKLLTYHHFEDYISSNYPNIRYIIDEDKNINPV